MVMTMMKTKTMTKVYMMMLMSTLSHTHILPGYDDDDDDCDFGDIHITMINMMITALSHTFIIYQVMRMMMIMIIMVLLLMMLLLMRLIMLVLMVRLMLMMKRATSRISEVLLEVESRIIEVSVLPHRRHCCTSKSSSSSSSSSSYLKMIPRLFPDLIKSSKARGVPEKILCCGENEKGSCGGRNQLAGSPELYTKHRSSSRSIAV